MSESSRRGLDFERKIASILRSKLGAKVVRDRRSGAGTNRSDILDYYREIPLHLELKDQETIKVKEWFRQAADSASSNHAPTLVFQVDDEILACLRFSDLVNFLVEIADQKAEIDDLRIPIDKTELSTGKTDTAIAKSINKEELDLRVPTSKKVAQGYKTCREGHVADAWGYCQQRGCKYSRGYRPPKGKK